MCDSREERPYLPARTNSIALFGNESMRILSLEKQARQYRCNEPEPDRIYLSCSERHANVVWNWPWDDGGESDVVLETSVISIL